MNVDLDPEKYFVIGHCYQHRDYNNSSFLILSTKERGAGFGATVFFMFVRSQNAAFEIGATKKSDYLAASDMHVSGKYQHDPDCQCRRTN